MCWIFWPQWIVLLGRSLRILRNMEWLSISTVVLTKRLVLCMWMMNIHRLNAFYVSFICNVTVCLRPPFPGQERPLRRIDPPACCQSAPPGIICPHCGSNIHKRKLFNGLLRCNLLLSLMSFLCLAVNPVCWCVTIFLVLLLFLAGNSDVK
eukprot:Protomagalhaensia_wolfi_Nauph_80__5702@NODE_677_length_2133_cov_60_964661_g504_i0_p2_GENE_NODE_677_length_2133_cov_60_964661_g504_i0NODE_677_length_2133_cov_60_964661_g504_i0_p2_ORF_typecomplete_len151_score4_25Zn_Tnp_IS1595/PF12760_7/0_028Peptidase_M50B/PF13398_6/12Peptidase_M50B/PF13398_6/9_2_NODE_677_length_2133_cov_60_964661_g504_i096548